jgi:hypothetical protein
VVKEILESVSNMSSCIVMIDDGVHCHCFLLSAGWRWLWGLCQNERTTAGDTLQHKSGDYLCWGQSLLVINRSECADGVRRLPQIWQVVVHWGGGGDYIEGICVCLHQVMVSFQNYGGVATFLYPTLIYVNIALILELDMLAKLYIQSLNFLMLCKGMKGARGSVVVKTLCYKPEGHGFETQWGEWYLSIYLILLAATGHGVYSPSNRNEYQKHKNNVSGE